MSNIEQKLLENLNISKSSELPYAALCYDWLPVEGDPSKITLLVLGVCVSEDNTVCHDLRKLEINFESSYSAFMTKGASEAIGLLPKTYFYFDDTKTAIFERNLADILSYMASAFLNNGIRTIIFQGPLFPKLIGRLGYKHYARDITFSAITFNPIWFPLSHSSSLVSVPQHPQDCILPRRDGSISTYRSVEIPLRNGLTETIKSFCVIAKDTDLSPFYFIDLFCQFPFDTERKKLLWSEKHGKVLRTFNSYGLVIFNGNILWLPFNLACAWDGCRIIKRASFEDLMGLQNFFEQLYTFEQDVAQMYRFSEPFSPVEIVGLRTYLAKASLDEQTRQVIEDKLLRVINNGSSANRYHHEKQKLKSSLEPVAWRGKCTASLLRYWREDLKSQNKWNPSKWRDLC
jgi:hypothetical protein